MKPHPRDTPVHHLLQHCYELGIVSGLFAKDIHGHPDRYEGEDLHKLTTDNKSSVLEWCKLYNVSTVTPVNLFWVGYSDAYNDYCKSPHELADLVNQINGYSICPTCIKPIRNHE